MRTLVEDELELLGAMFSSDEDELVVERPTGGGATISVRLRPSSGGEQQRRLMEATLALELSQAYPESAAAVCRLSRSRGMVGDEEAALLEDLTALAAEAASSREPCVYALVEAAIEKLTELNAGGDCPICRDDLFPRGAAPPPPTYVSACFHSFHCPLCCRRAELPGG